MNQKIELVWPNQIPIYLASYPGRMGGYCLLGYCLQSTPHVNYPHQLPNRGVVGHINIDRRLLTPEKLSGLHGKLRGKCPMDPPSFYAYVAASKLGTMASVARFPQGK